MELRAREGDDRASGEGLRGVLHRGGSGRASPVGGCWHKWLGQGVVLRLARVHLQRGTLGTAMYKTFRDRAGARVCWPQTQVLLSCWGPENRFSKVCGSHLGWESCFPAPKEDGTCRLALPPSEGPDANPTAEAPKRGTRRVAEAGTAAPSLPRQPGESSPPGSRR